MRGDLFFYLNNKNYTKSKWKYRRVFFINKIALDLHIKDVITEIRMTSKLDKLTNAESHFRLFFSRLLFVHVTICKARGNFSFDVFILTETLLVNASAHLSNSSLRVCIFNVKYPADKRKICMRGCVKKRKCFAWTILS